MRGYVPFACRILFLAALAAAGVTSAADEPRAIPDPAVVARQFPQAATSSDGFVRVLAAVVTGDDALGFRDPILRYAGRLVGALDRGLGLPPLARRSRPGLVIVAQDGRTNDTRVVTHRTFNPRLGQTETRVWLPSPGFSDFNLLRRAIVRAWLRARIDAELELPRPRGARPPAEPAEAFVTGVLRQADLAQVRADLRAVRDTALDGRLPAFPHFVAGAAADPARAGYLVGWMKEKRLLPAYFRAAAAGRVWTAADVARRLTDADDPVRQDAVADERVLRLMRKVIAPGTATVSDLRVFATRLLLYPDFYDTMCGNGTSGRSFRAAALAPPDAALRRAAERKALEVPVFALGRGEAVRDAALAYGDFLRAFARGEEPGRLLLRLDEADIKLETAYRMARKNEEVKR